MTDEATRLREARTLFERAQRDGISMGEARRRMHEERWQALNARLRAKTSGGLCGTAAPASAGLDGGTAARSEWAARQPWMFHD